MKDLEWDLEILYKGFDDPKYFADFSALKQLIEQQSKLESDDEEYIKKYLELEEKIYELVSELSSYASLRSAVNVSDNAACNELNKLTILCQDTITPNIKFQKYLKGVNLEELKEKMEIVNRYFYRLSNIKQSAIHMLSDKEEILEEKFKLVASSSWSSLQETLTSNLMIKVKGFKNKMPLSEVRGLAYDSDKDVRFNAYKAELKSYEQISSSIAFALNNIKREANMMANLRGYNSVLEKTLLNANMQEATLKAMIDAINDEKNNICRYFELKALALGYKNGLPFYELFAPMGKLTKTYTFEEAKKEVLTAYKFFSTSLYEMGKEAFENNWIDVLPHNGKVGGAFCAGIDNHKQSRILTNFTGSLGDVQTLAHELGHAYHGKVCLNNAILNRDYPMQLAETASIFCQTLMAKKMLNELSDPFEKLTVIEQALQEDTQCIIDILSRFIFESSVLSKPIEENIDDNTFCEMMKEAQIKAYGNGLDKKYLHKYMWCCKSHYYSADLNYYNYPYAFGLLYGKGLFKQYLKDKETFVKNYDKMLQNTALMNTEEVAKTMNIDITKKEFWIESLKFIEEDINSFEKILKETKLI